MDDIQTWIYIIIGIIYFVIRSLKKKAPDPSEQGPSQSSGPQRSDSERRKPLTFEELLKEFTDPQAGRESEEVDDDIEEAEPEKTKADFAKEGSVRRFSDEESRRVYEESIKQAEGFDLEYSTDDDYHTEKLTAIRHDHEEEEETFAGEIKEMLSDPEDARKAIILGEILNRRY